MKILEIFLLAKESLFTQTPREVEVQEIKAALTVCG